MDKKIKNDNILTMVTLNDGIFDAINRNIKHAYITLKS